MSSPITVRSQSRIITTRLQIFASHSSATAPKREKDAKKRVVITGMGLMSMFGNDVDVYYERLLAGESGISFIDRFDASKLTTRFAGQIRGFKSNGYIDSKTDQRLDDCQRYCIVAGKKLLKILLLEAPKVPSWPFTLISITISLKMHVQINKDRAGVLVGSGAGGYTVSSDGVEALIKRGYHRISPFLTPLMMTNMGSALLAIDLGFTGPNYSISAACATSNFCFLAAANHIRDGKADLMIAGGVESSVIPITMGGFTACNALSQRNDDPQTASRPWDKDRDGFVMGEGAGALVLESLEHAMKRDAPILAKFLGCAIACDAYHITNPRSDGHNVFTCMQKSLMDAGVSVEEKIPTSSLATKICCKVNYINAHATSTLIGDPAKVNALKKLFKNTEGIKMNATKCMIGHCMGAAGGLEAIATIKAIQTGWLHPTINQINPEPYVDFDTVSNRKQQHEINVGISNSFSIGGHNSVVAFSAFEP
ncbi:plastid 3-keto-acyl-ACP synthase I [Artemisia annua]|uniref:3-oxoacyl-[acyl-carrier-protein] synthase I, chloroplastic n=1 Tax=Artemisia annua TaxID=35608 RepID=A0A2U1N0B6_ARTAN|nr:plastid 3-keto-acyl-ACP synthase I [Artemisia annua]